MDLTLPEEFRLPPWSESSPIGVTDLRLPAWLESLPIGFRLAASDNYLTADLLANKVFDGLPFPFYFFLEINPYDCDPHQLPFCKSRFLRVQEGYYFFTSKEPINSEETGTSRTTQGGYWKQSEKDVNVISDEKIVGFKKKFVFYQGKEPNGEKSEWIMNEYRLNPTIFPHQAFSDCLLAKIERSFLCKIQNLDTFYYPI